MRVWQVILCLVVCFLISYALLRGGKETKSEPTVERTNIDSLKSILVKLQKDNDSLVLEIAKIEKGKIIIKKEYYEKDNSLKYINADSNIKLFRKWNGQLQNNSYQERYFRLGSDTVH
jgi:hypothetical protein